MRLKVRKRNGLYSTNSTSVLTPREEEKTRHGGGFKWITLEKHMGYVKLLVYADKPQTFDYLEYNICRVIADMRLQMLEKVIENWTSSLDYIRASRSSPIPEIIFKM
ncbi:hypothetical protein TNCV_438351 [Trichonephila clavipes]|nr:hypothetical protein TNCV_438351 [Trichonephila clavipes]